MEEPESRLFKTGDEVVGGPLVGGGSVVIIIGGELSNLVGRSDEILQQTLG